MKVSDKDLKRILREEISSVISKRSILRESKNDSNKSNQTAYILQPQYTDFIRQACYILAWKGLNYDINVKSPVYQADLNFVKKYMSARREALKLPDEKLRNETLKKVKDRYKTLIDKIYVKAPEGSEHAFVDKSLEMFKDFKTNACDYILSLDKLENGRRGTKQMEKAAVEEANKEVDKKEQKRYEKELAEWEELMCNPETKEKYRFAKPFLYLPSENAYTFIQESVIYDNED